MEKKAKNIRLRLDQVAAIAEIEAADPETDLSKVVRLAVDDFLASPKGKALLAKSRKRKK